MRPKVISLEVDAQSTMLPLWNECAEFAESILVSETI